jgi:hypothetical protein
MEKNEMGGKCRGMGKGRGVCRVLGGNLRERGHWGDQGVGGRKILILIFRKWIRLAQDRDRWRALVNAVMNLRFP